MYKRKENTLEIISEIRKMTKWIVREEENGS
jgi:hypothetical protein